MLCILRELGVSIRKLVENGSNNAARNVGVRGKQVNGVKKQTKKVGGLAVGAFSPPVQSLNWR